LNWSNRGGPAILKSHAPNEKEEMAEWQKVVYAGVSMWSWEQFAIAQIPGAPKTKRFGLWVAKVADVALRVNPWIPGRTPAVAGRRHAGEEGGATGRHPDHLRPDCGGTPPPGRLPLEQKNLLNNRQKPEYNEIIRAWAPATGIKRPVTARLAF
jgi:hypothetical protein